MKKMKWRRLTVLFVIIGMIMPNTFNVYAEETPKEIGYLVPDGHKKLELSGNITKTVSITENTTIVFTGDTTINVPKNGGNGILLKDGITVTLALCGYNVTIKTADVGKAGIRVPKNAKLIIKEGSAPDGSEGTLTVTGGPGTAPAKGTDGVGALAAPGTMKGNGGAGGKGGDAPGAGIGGDGTKGGQGGKGGNNSSVYQSQNNAAGGASGEDGTEGVSSSAAGQCGDVFVIGNISVTVEGGKHEPGNLTQSSGGSNYEKSGLGASGGGGGGNGGSAYGAAGIGGGGIGGGGGGGGGAGGYRWLSNNTVSATVWTAGGGGGAGQSGGLGGMHGKSDHSVGSDGQSGGAHTGGDGGPAVKDGAAYNQAGNASTGAGGKGGSSPSIIAQTSLGKTYISDGATLKQNTSAGSTTNSAANQEVKNNIYLLSELDVSVENPEDIKYTGMNIEPTILIKDKQGNDISSVLNKNYGITYSNNKDAGEMTAKISFKSMGSVSDNNYLFVDEGTHTYSFTIHPNDDPITIKKEDTHMSYTYGDSFKATVEMNSYNTGKIVWSGELDEKHTGDAIGASDTNKTTDIIPTKVGQLKLKVSVIQQTKNSNNCYNFVDLEATLAGDIEIKKRDIADGVINIPNLRNYTYIGTQIQPKYTTEDKNTPITYTTNKDTAHTNLTETNDYELVYGDNFNIGEGTVKIKGVGNYKGETNKTFTINSRDINDTDVDVTVTDVDFTGQEMNVEPTLKILGNTLPASDRTLVWESYDEDNITINAKGDLINIGAKKITITGTGNITGERTIDFHILPADIGTINLDVTEAEDVYFDGKEIESRPTLKYYNFLLTEDNTPVDLKPDIINPNDYTISFKNHKEVGKATITLTGINNFKGTKTLNYDVLPRPLYILPDAGQWKYYGAKDIFGTYQDKEHPTYEIYIRQLNDSSTKELKDGDVEKDKTYMMLVKDNLPITGYGIDLLGHLSRKGADDIVLNDKPNTNYEYTIGDLKLSDATKDSYDVRLINNQNYYKLESYLYDGPTIELEGTIGKNDWYIKNPALLQAPNGFTISKKDSMTENPWATKISYDDGDYSKDGVSFFVRVDDKGSPADGAISSAIGKQFKQDTVSPTGNLVINSDSFNVLNPNADFNFYLNTDLSGMIFAKDAMSQVFSKLYYISETKLDKTDLDALSVPKPGDNIYNPIGGSTGIPIDYDGSTWIDESQFRMSIDTYNTKSKILYVRIEDNAGNVTYLNSDGIVFDKDAPILKAEYKQDGQWTIDEDVYISGNVYDEVSGLKERYVAYQIDDGALQIIDTKDMRNGDFTIKNMKDGNYNLTISAWDKANNQAAPFQFHVMKDTQMPRIILEADTTTIATKQKITLKPNVGASQVAKLEVKYNEGPWQTVKNDVLAAYYAEQNGTYTFRITNGAGVMSKESSITFTKIDPHEPIIDLEVANIKGAIVQDNDYVNSEIHVLFKNIEKNLGDSRFEYQLDSGQWIEANENLDNEADVSINGSEGSHTLTFRITGKNGLKNEKDFHFSVDTTIPTVNGRITIEDATDGGFFRAIADFFTNKKQKVTMNAIDSGSGIASTQYYIVKGKETLKTLPSDDKGIEKMIDARWEDGARCEVDKGSEYIVYFKVADKAGNIAYARSDRIVIDNAVPEIEVTYEKNGQWDNNPQFDVYVWDENPGVQSVKYTVDNGADITASEMFTVKNLQLSSGDHIVQIMATDKSGNESTKTVNIKCDVGEPSITATEKATTDKEVAIKVEASYAGTSHLSQILVSKNSQDFEDITDKILRGELYYATENGDYVFRAVSGAGAIKDTIPITIDQFTATAADLEAVVSAKTADNKKYESDTWTNQEVTVHFSNKIANLNGLAYQLREDNGSWQVVNAVNGYVSIPVSTEGKHHYEFKVILNTQNPNKESDPVSFEVNIDKGSPSAKMTIKDKSWTKNDLVFGFDNYFNASQYAEVSGEDLVSGIDDMEMFVIKESEMPNSIKGATVASQIEELGKNSWQKVNRLVIDPSDKYIAFGKVYDKAGNISYVSSNGVVFDNVNPTLKTDIDQVNWYKDNTSIITFDTSDNLAEVDKVLYSINGNTKQTAKLDYGSFTLLSSELDNGINHIEVEVIDKAGNVLTSEFVAKKDNETPVIKVIDKTTTGSKLVTKHYLSVEASVGQSGIAKIEVKSPDAGGWTDITDTYKDGFIAEENGTYWFRVVSESGVNSTAQITFGNISKDIPVITYVMSNADGSTYYSGEWKKENVKVQFTNENANQIVEKYMYRIDDGSYQTLKEEKDNSAIFESKAGSHTYTMKLVLDNGLESEELSVPIYIDSQNPHIQVHSDLSQWVKETQELEVEVIDNESGIANDGYSFDNGNNWQSENKATIHANKLVGVYAKDNVANTSKEKVVIDKIDSQGPTVETFRQVGTEKSKTRTFEADITDYKDLTKQAGSGIDKAYIMTNYPYKDGEFEANPDKTYVMEETNGSWTTKKAVTVPYNGTNDIWLVTEDKVGNMKIYSTQANNMIGSGDDEGNIDRPGPINPDNQEPNDKSNPNKSGTDESNSSTQTITTVIEGTSLEKRAESINTNQDDVNKLAQLQETLKKSEQTLTDAKKVSVTEYIYFLPWVLVILLIILILYLRRKYLRIKKSYEENEKEV